MTEQALSDNKTLVAFWDSFFVLSEEEKEAARQEGMPWEALAPSEKLLKAVCAFGAKKNVLDLGCGNGWASIAAAKNGCKAVTAADPAPHAADAVRFLAGLFDVSDRVHPVCCDGDWLKTVPAETFDGVILSNVLDVLPPKTAEEILRETARTATADADILISMNAYLTPEKALEKGIELTAERTAYIDGVLRLVSRTDAEWAALFAPFFTVESLDHFAWPGETEETRRLFRLRRRQTV